MVQPSRNPPLLRPVPEVLSRLFRVNHPHTDTRLIYSGEYYVDSKDTAWEKSLLTVRDSLRGGVAPARVARTATAKNDCTRDG
ncbi:hypothetical protein Moror_13902 [Moniliophthora roreri MCA 2997]|uniref:Uncharacterized protein n=1 Tax=Moniliophthora roreri (strain MCA 2997) TaxID=1381753 RepID=V2XQA6_MONRO|nr:hypothetical protein Moror_13902 [Moniliophthora roreri MCA 2997]